MDENEQKELIFSFEVYHKAAFSGISISGKSFHHRSHILAATNAFIHRLVSLPLSAHAFYKELGVIKFLTKFNGVNMDVDRTVQRKINNYNRQSISTLRPINDSKKKK